MNESEFERLGHEELAYLEEKLADVDPDEIEITSSDGVLTLALRDGVRVVINTHRAARQIWMAAVASAWHFDPPPPPAPPLDQRAWSTTDGQTLRPTVKQIIRARIGLEIDL